MDFDDSPAEAAFREEAAVALRELIAERQDAKFHLGVPGGDEDESVMIALQKDWQAALYRAGWAGITWPQEHGGRGGTTNQEVIFNEELARRNIPQLGIFIIGLRIVGPTLIRHGTEEQKHRYLRPLLKGEELWCQLFSEPGAGSDLAGVRTSARSDGNEWIVNGQKVWTSGAHYREFGLLLARTDSSRPKHLGLTCFIVDMKTPGVVVRPLRQMTGGATFNEVFLSDVRLPSDAVVGEVDEGWTVARTTLMNERVALGGGDKEFQGLVDLARRYGRLADPIVRQDLADVYVRSEVLRYLGLRHRTAISRGTGPGPEGSVAKLASSTLAQRVGDLALAIQGPAGVLADSDAPDDGAWQLRRLYAPSSRIAGGTDEVMRNILGERVLGLPREPAADRDIPFRELVGPR